MLWLVHLQTQEQIAASHEFDGVRKEKERLTAASLTIEIKEQACDSKFKSHETHCSLTGSLSFWQRLADSLSFCRQV